VATNNNSGNQRNQPNTGQQGPAQTGPKQTGPNNPLEDAFKGFAQGTVELKDIANLLAKITDLMAQQDAYSQKIKKGSKDWGSELRQNMEFADDIDKSTRKMMQYQAQIKKDGMKPSDLKKITNALKEMQKVNKDQTERGIFSKKMSQVMKKQASDIETALKRLGKVSEETFSADHIREMQELMGKMAEDSKDLARNMKSVRWGSATHEMHGANRAIEHLFQRKGKTVQQIQKIKKYAAVGTEIRAAHADRRAGRISLFKERQDRIRDRTHDEAGKPIFSSGSDSKAQFYKTSRATARDEGLGSIASRVYANAATKEATGEKQGFASRFAMHTLERGGGHMGHGVTAMAAGFLESGAGQLAEMAGPLAPAIVAVTAIAGVLKAAVDKNRVMNSDVDEKLGGSIYGAGDPMTSIQQVRQNLNGPLFSSLGIGYEKNLAIASSLQQAGFSNQTLAGGPQSQDSRGMLGGSFGSLQRNVYAYGRTAGLDSSQTMDETIKLVTQYKQTLESTEDFFISINKATRTAGITTMKYLQLIDETNSHYDRSNKMLETTVDLMRMLSITGRHTAEDIKDAIDAATSGGSKRSLEVKSYLNTQMLSSPEALARFQGERDRSVRDSAGEVSKALNPDGGDMRYTSEAIQKGLEGPNGGLNFINELRDAVSEKTDHNGHPDYLARSTNNAAIDKLSKDYQRQQLLKSATAGGRMDAVGLATGSNALGEDIGSQRMDTMTSIETAMRNSGHSFADIYKPGGLQNLQKDLAFQKQLELTGTDPKKTNDLLTTMPYDVAKARVQVSQQGMPSNLTKGTPEYTERKQLLEESYRVLKAQGAIGLASSGDMIRDLQEYTKKSPLAAASGLARDPMALHDIAGSALGSALREALTADDRSKALSQAESLTAGTRSTADIFVDAFTSLFNRLQGPLDAIAATLSHIPNLNPFATVDIGQEMRKRALDKSFGDGTGERAHKAWDDQVRDLELQPASEARDKRLTAAKASQARLDAAWQAESKGYSSALSPDTVNGSLKDVINAPMSRGDADKMFADAGVKFIQGAATTLNAAQYDQLQKKIPALPGGYMDTTSTGKDGKVTHSITNNYLNLDASVGGAAAQQALNDGKEKTTPVGVR